MLIAPKKVRQMMIQAQRRGMCSGDYAFFALDALKTDIVLSDTWQRNYNDDDEVRPMCHALFVLTLRFSTKDPAFMAFAKDVRNHAALTSNGGPPPNVNYYSSTFYDSVYVYATVVNESLAEGRAITKDNADYFANKFNNRIFNGMTFLQSPQSIISPLSQLMNKCFQLGSIGQLYLDNHSDRADDYQLRQVLPDDNDPIGTNKFVVSSAWIDFK